MRDEAKELIAATEKKAYTSQNDVTEKLGERVQNISYWKFELERGIEDTRRKSFLIHWNLSEEVLFHALLSKGQYDVDLMADDNYMSFDSLFKLKQSLR